MKKILLIFSLIFMILFTVNGFAKKKAEKLVKIGCVDLTAIFDSTPQKKEIEAQLKTKRQELQAKKDAMEKQLAELTNELANYRNKGKDKKVLEYNMKVFNKKKELADFIETSNNQLSESEDNLLHPLLKTIQSIIKEVSVREGFSMIIDKSSYVFYVEKDLDITKDVIEELQKQYKEEKRIKAHE